MARDNFRNQNMKFYDYSIVRKFNLSFSYRRVKKI